MKRLDVLLVEKGIYLSREKAKQAVESGRVMVNEKVVTKPAYLCDVSANIVGLPFEFVSRGGFKLQKALEVFGIDLKNKVVLDVGASTGGFTDVCLQNGAKKVYAVDTGEGQLVEKIKADSRVVNLEKTNFLTLPVSEFVDIDFVCIDVSFVSLTKIAPKLADDLHKIFEQRANACDKEKKVKIVALIKPQFEVGLEYARKHKGVVKDEKMHDKVVKNIVAFFENLGFVSHGVTTSPIKGGDGNTEFLSYFSFEKEK